MKDDDCKYWIINLIKEAVRVYTLNSEGLYEQSDTKVSKDIADSIVMNSFKVDLKDIFD